MPKLGMEPIRKRQLIDATIASIHAYGYGDTTVARIGRAAGVSPGIIHHYFGGKGELLEATMRSLLRGLRRSVIKRLEHAHGPRARIEAIIDGNFAGEQFAPEAVTAWLAFWAQVPHAPRLARLQHVNAQRLRSNLRHAFRELLPAARVDRATSGLAAMLDGLWLRCALTPGGIAPSEARSLAGEYLEHQLIRHRN